MTEKEIREVIADAMNYAAVPGFKGSANETGFLAGTAEVPFSEVDLDSLAAMEVCISIETNVGISILPAELEQIGSLGGLVRRVMQNGAAGNA